MARIKMVIGSNEFEAEGDEAFLQNLYEDFKVALTATRPADEPSAPRDPKPPRLPVSTDAPTEERHDDANKQRSARKRRISTVAVDRDLNLRPDGVQSFADFAAAKQPLTNDEKNLICVFYVTDVLSKACGVTQVMSCYDDRNWRIPTDLRNSLQQTASKRGWIDTESSNVITVTVKGGNVVKHDMPAKKAES